MKRQRSLSAAAVVAGGVAWAAALAAAVLPGLRSAPDPTPLWGAAWSARVAGSGAVWAAAVGERLALATGLLAVVAASGAFTLLLLLVGGKEARRPALAVRAALGAAPARLAVFLLRGERRRITVMGVGGLLGGLVCALVLRATWPGSGGFDEWAVASPWVAVLGTVVGGAVLGAAVLLAGILAPLVGLRGRAPALLRRGHGVTDDPRAGTVRRGTATLQVGLSFALALTGIGLVLGLDSAPGGTPAAVVADLPIGRYAGGRLPLSAPLLASPGTWIGVGVRDLVTVECGACSRGTIYLPIYGVDSTVYAVGRDVLAALGGRVVEGRGFRASDGPDSEAVAVVNEVFRRHFEGGRPLGHRIRLSGPGNRWVRVVGVVRDPPFRGPGAPASTEPALWLPLAQHPAEVVEGALQEGDDGAMLRAVRALDAPRPLRELRQAALAPLGWAGWILMVSGTVALALALVSSMEVARVEAGGRARAAAVRVALGAPPTGPAGQILRRAFTGGVQGALLGMAVAWALGGALGVGTSVSASVRWALAAAVVAAGGLGAWPRARDLFRIQPARLLRED